VNLEPSGADKDTDVSALGRTRQLKPPLGYKVERMKPLVVSSRKASLSWLVLNKSLLRGYFLLCVIALVICAFYLRLRISVVDNEHYGQYDRSLSGNKATNQSSSSVPKKKEEESARPGKKIFIAFNYWEQVTMATNSFLDLTALAAYGGRQVVLPFAKDSSFYGTPTEKGLETLSLYYNVSALNRTLRSRGHGTLISWEEFQDICHGKLDILVHFVYKKPTERNTPEFFQCDGQPRNTFGGLKVQRTICINVFAIDSIEKFENDVIARLPCIGFAEWRGINRGESFRTHFDLSAVVPHNMRSLDTANFFSSRLLEVTRDFIAKRLGPLFVSAHIRTEKIGSRVGVYFDKLVKTCISNLANLVQKYKNASRGPIPLFLATDFGDYGSLSGGARTARKKANSLMKDLAPLNPIIFQPSTYNLTDHGAVAIVEMNIVTSGSRFFVVGGGSFQEWQVDIFLNKINTDQNKEDAKTKCKNELCNMLCCL